MALAAAGWLGWVGVGLWLQLAAVSGEHCPLVMGSAQASALRSMTSNFFGGGILFNLSYLKSHNLQSPYMTGQCNDDNTVEESKRKAAISGQQQIGSVS